VEVLGSICRAPQFVHFKNISDLLNSRKIVPTVYKLNACWTSLKPGKQTLRRSVETILLVVFAKQDMYANASVSIDSGVGMMHSLCGMKNDFRKDEVHQRKPYSIDTSVD
jgi:hypothetical protein